MSDTAKGRRMRLVRGTSSVWIAAFALSCLLGTSGGMLLAQATGSNPLTENGGQQVADRQHSQPTGPHGENMAAGGKCPVTARRRSSPMTSWRSGARS